MATLTQGQGLHLLEIIQEFETQSPEFIFHISIRVLISKGWPSNGSLHMLFLLVCQTCRRPRASLRGWVMAMLPPEFIFQSSMACCDLVIILFHAVLAVLMVANNKNIC